MGPDLRLGRRLEANPTRLRAYFATAGASPQIRPLTPVRTVAATSSGQLTAISDSLGNESGSLAAAACTRTTARAAPAAPPIQLNARLSVSNCRNIVLRAAPSARRTPNSRLRPAALTKSKFARLTHAMSRISATAPSRMRRRGRALWITSSRRGIK